VVSELLDPGLRRDDSSNADAISLVQIIKISTNNFKVVIPA
jgi:hypothetical protein